MSGFSYAGRDFSPYVQAELVEPAAHALEPRAFPVPGRPGALLLGCELSEIAYKWPDSQGLCPGITAGNSPVC